jgi:alkaline phosphatase
MYYWKRLLLIEFVFIFFSMPRLFAQPVRYSVQNAHSHNDYINPIPFYTAYGAGFGSIEADIFLINDSLFVGHELADVKAKRTLEKLYLQPIDSCIQQHGGWVYPNKTSSLQLLIDVKLEAVSTLKKLMEVLKKYPAIIQCKSLKIAITGNRPSPALFATYPNYIWFDGILSMDYPSEALPKIVLFSDNLQDYVHWNGKPPLSLDESLIVKKAIARAHQLKKPVRFWNAPDTELAWEQFKGLGADFINTDHIQTLARYLQ